MLHHSIVVGWAVTPTSLFALPGFILLAALSARLWYRIWCWNSGAQLWYRIVPFLFPVESTQGARWAHLGCVKDQKHVRAWRPYKATVTPGPFASYHARRE